MSSKDGKDRIEERIYKSLWHVLIAGVGVYELRNHKTKLSKVLAVGLIAFHVDGALADITDTTPYSRKLLDAITGKPGIKEYEPEEQLRTSVRPRLSKKVRKGV